MWRRPAAPTFRTSIQGAHSDDSRPGGSAADLHHGGLEAPPVTHSVAFHRVRGKPAQWATKTSCAEWTGVLLSTLLKECGLKSSATWFVAEGAEEVKGASSMPVAKAMDDCIIAYGQNGEPLRPQQGFPLRIVVPGFEGIFNTK